MKHLLLVFLYYAEEGGVLSFLGLSLLGVQPTKKQLCIIALTQGSIVGIVRGLYEKFGLPFGSHILILLLTLIVIIKLICRTKWEIASAASILGLVMIGVCEIFVYSLLPSLFNISMQQAFDFPFPFLLVAYASLMPLIILGILVNRTKFSFTQYIGNGH